MVAATVQCPKRETARIMGESQVAGNSTFVGRGYLPVNEPFGFPVGPAARLLLHVGLLADSAQRTLRQHQLPSQVAAETHKPKGLKFGIPVPPSPTQIVGGPPGVPRPPGRGSAPHPHLAQVPAQPQVLALGSQHLERLSRQCCPA